MTMSTRNRAIILSVGFFCLAAMGSAQSGGTTPPTREAAIEQKRKSLTDAHGGSGQFVEPALRKTLKDKQIALDTPSLTAALKDPDSSARFAALYFLTRNDARESAPAIRALLSDPDSTNQLAAAEDLAKIGDDSGFGIAFKRARESEKGNRRIAMGSLLEFARFPKDQPEVVKFYEESLHDPDKDIRVTAAAGLALVGDPAALPALVKARDEERDESTRQIMAGHIQWLQYLETLKP
jgi:HEAT repeat protein